jgi:hypothetical protein
MVLALATVGVVFATIGVAIVAYSGLRAIALSKKDMKNRAIREETQCAIDRCNEMGGELLPLFMSFVREIGAKGVPIMIRDPAQVSFHKAEEAKKIAEGQTWISKLDRDTQDRSIHLLNSLECWAMSFTTDPSLADERSVFDGVLSDGHGTVPLATITTAGKPRERTVPEYRYTIPGLVCEKGAGTVARSDQAASRRRAVAANTRHKS